MHKKINWFVSCFGLIILLSLFSCNRKNNFFIKGQLENSKAGYIYLAEMNLSEIKPIDSAHINNKGFFKFKCNIDNPGFYQILFNQNNFIILLIEPGQKISINADANDLSDNYSVKGSEGSLQVKILTDHLSMTRKTLDSLENIIDVKVGTKGFDTVYKRLNDQYIKTIKNQRKFSIKFIIEHLHSLSSIIALYQQLNDSTFVLNQNRDLQFINIVSDTLNKYYPNSKPVRILCNDRNKLNNIYSKLKLNYLSKNSKKLSFPDIALQNNNGDTIHLNQLKSKVILLFFWSPYNEDCISAMNGIKELYTLYKKKGFEVYNIALMEDKQEWEKYITNNNLPGINVIDQKVEISYYCRLYNVNSLPASFLIGPDREIAARDLFGENLRKKLIEILK